MNPEITDKSKKSEILDAYQKALKELRDSKKTSRKEEKILENKQNTIETAQQNTPNKLIRELADLKLKLVNFLDDIGEHVVNEHRKLTGIQKAIEIENDNFKEKHEVNLHADALEALVLANKQQNESFEQAMQVEKASFEQGMAETKKQWEKEKNETLMKLQEEKNIAKKTKQREEEEYLYKTKLQRERDQDTYESNKENLEQELKDKKLCFEKEFSEREAALKMSESELNELREKAKTFPGILENAVAEAEENVSITLTQQHQFEIALKAKEIEGELKLKAQKIEALELKIKEQGHRIEHLIAKASQSNEQTQTIALKAIESSAAKPNFDLQHLKQETSHSKSKISAEV